MLNTEANMLNNMLTIATAHHSGQYDKGGVPYILHCLKVMHYLKTTDEQLMCIALGHDIIEDTKISYKTLKSCGFSDRIIEGIRALTKMPGEDYEDYKNKVKSNPDAIRVKMCDLRHNSDIRRLKGVTEKDIARIQKYHEFYLELTSLVGKSNDV